MQTGAPIIVQTRLNCKVPTSNDVQTPTNNINFIHLPCSIRNLLSGKIIAMGALVY